MSLERSSPRALSIRAVVLGLTGVCLICGLTPYNDYVLNNTFLVGNNLPLGVILMLFLFTILVNGPLSKWLPKYAFTSGEIAVAFSMTLISCALPSSGLMRYFPASLVSPLWYAGADNEYLKLMESLHLRSWLYPSFSGQTVRQWARDPIVTGYVGLWTENKPIPYRAWVMPALTWGIFLAALYGALLCVVAIVRKQWFENERLPFPLAQIEISLVQQPEPGRWFSNAISYRSFWIAFGCIFLLHNWNGCAAYFPQYFMRIPVNYNLWDLFADPPFMYVDTKIKDAAIFFTAAGVAYFLPGHIAFSLWFFYILQQFYRVYLGVSTGDSEPYGQLDQHFGAIIAFALTVLWIGRRHWRVVLAAAFGRGESGGRYLPYAGAFWGLIGCLVVMILWLMAAGMNLLGAVVAVAMLMLLFFVITRIVAETGLVQSQLRVSLCTPWQLLAECGILHTVPLDTFYLTSMLQTVHYDYREVVPVYASHGMRVADETIFAGRDPADGRRLGRRFIASLVLALLVGYAVSFFSTLYMEYHYEWTKDVVARRVNEWGTDLNPQVQELDATLQYQKSYYYPKENPPAHLAFGFGLTLLLSFLRLRYTWWPLHPIGYLMLSTYPGAHLWFSIFVGWLCKVVILRFGGPKMYVDAKPFFLGLIVGEATAAGFWLVMGVVLSALNLPYRPVNIMPG